MKGEREGRRREGRREGGRKMREKGKRKKRSRVRWQDNESKRTRREKREGER